MWNPAPQQPAHSATAVPMAVSPAPNTASVVVSIVGPLAPIEQLIDAEGRVACNARLNDAARVMTDADTITYGG